MENKTITEPPIVVVTHNDEPVEITSDESITISDSSSTANTSLHDEYIPYYNQSEFQGPVIHHYRHKSILLTGATGFVGKAILWKLMQSLRQDIGHVYLLIRSGGNKRSKIGRPAERLKNEIFNNKAFVLLRQRMGKSIFDEIVEQKIIPVTGDIISPDLSLSQTDREQIVRHVQIVIHCAAALNYNERLDLTLETNTLGTLRVMDLADECQQMEAFIHTSLAYTDPSIPHGHLQERVYPMKLGDPEELLTEIVDLELKEIPKMTQRILAYYPNTYTFTKALTEHLIMKRVDINRVEEAQGGKKQWPVAIVRATQVGPAVFEPLPGWVDGVTGANGLIYLMGKGIQVLSTDVSRTRADIVPVDYFARVVISCATELYPPGYKFILPYNEIVDEKEHDSILLPNVQYFPYIYQLSRPTYTWREIYEAVKTYWVRNTPVMLPSAEDYFGSKLFKTSFFNKQKMPSSVASILGSSDAVNRTIELASRVVRSVEPFLRHQWIWDHPNVDQLIAMDDPQFDLSVFDKIHPYTYAVNAAFGTHAYLSPSLPPLPALRKITLADGWYCSHFGPPESQHPLVDGPMESVVFSASEIERRTDRMVKEVMMALENPTGEVKEKKKLEVWMNDFDAFLDDWCHDDSEKLKNTEHMRHLGFWLHRPEGHEEHVRIEVLNDRRVGNCIKQIVESSGVPQKTVVGEALKILQRMRERTELHYIWSAGAFLHSLFGRLFTSLRVFEADLIRLRAEGENKNVVYVPICKSMTDQLLVWYICLRYELPLPAIVCDEVMALLGPISDILRITGAYFVRRDLSSRSPLSTAVTAAYTEVLLSEHGALSMAIERTRSRTGRLQTTYHDGLINMVIEATVGKDHVTTPTDSLPTPTASFSSVKKDTVFVPVHITYEKIPELRTLIDQVLDQRSRSTSSLTSTTFLRPSATVADREALTKDKGVPEKGKYGRAFVAFGKAVDVKSSVQEASLSENKRQSDIPVKDEDVIADFIAKKIQKGQHEASIISPVALTAATLLYGRIGGGITLGKLYQHVAWLHEELLEKKVRVDWQPDEDVQTIVAYAFHLLDARSNLVMDGKRMTEETVVRVVEHTDNVMDLSYVASQLIEIFLPEALFSVVYLSNAGKCLSREEFLVQFTFLVRLFKHEFVYPWNRQEKFNVLLDWFLKKNLLFINSDGNYEKVVTVESNEIEYTRVSLLASFIYPTLDAYWITSCSLSALRDLPYMPRSIVPILSQWIAAHLITGRRTVYREVLSTEASQNAVDNFLAIGFINAVHPKTKLSPDTQILLLELDITTNEDLVMVSSQKNIEQEELFEEAYENILLKLPDIASLCHEIEKYRLVSDNINFRHNAQVFDKCQNQIRSILRAEKSYASQRGIKLDRDEDQMIQLVYSLKAATSSVIDDGSGKHSRRISQAYNLKS